MPPTTYKYSHLFSDDFIDNASDPVKLRAEFWNQYQVLSEPHQHLLGSFLRKNENLSLTLIRAEPCRRTQHVEHVLKTIQSLVS